jgi:hypothetical protein
MRFVRVIARVARGLAFAAAAAAVVFVVALYDDGADVLVAAVAVVPAVVLFLFSFALAEVAELPDRLRNAPTQARDLRSAVEDLARARGGRLPRALWRAGRQAASARELATPWAPLLPLLSLPFLAATAISALITPFVLLAALVVLALRA